MKKCREGEKSRFDNHSFVVSYTTPSTRHIPYPPYFVRDRTVCSYVPASATVPYTQRSKKGRICVRPYMVRTVGSPIGLLLRSRGWCKVAAVPGHQERSI